MTLYAVFGVFDDGETDFDYFYGVFSSKEKAKEIIKNLKTVECFSQDDERLEIRKITVDEPTDLYNWMLEP